MKPAVRIGIGFDFHPFDEGQGLFLGGVKIPHSKSLHGHSDADVLTHSIIDALLGAASLGDIGTHFPDNNPRYAGISSLTLLTQTFELIRDKAWLVGNVDVVVIAEEPPINPYRDAIQDKLSEILRILPGDISIKATTMEGKGPIGRKEGIAVQAVVLLYKEV